MSAELTAVILAGGKGSRLQPFTFSIPKPLLPLHETPILEIVLKQLAQQGFKRIIITLGYLGEMIQHIIGDGERFDVKIEYVTEETPLGTAGSISLIDSLPEYSLIMNGDLLTTMNYANLLKNMAAKGAVAGVATNRRAVFIDFGVLESNESGMLKKYIEKPTHYYEVSMGVYVLSRKARELIDGSYLDMPTLLSDLMERSEPVLTESFDGYWQDIGRISDYEKATEDFRNDPQRFFTPE